MKGLDFEYVENIHRNIAKSTQKTTKKLFLATFPGMTEVLRHSYVFRRKIL
jgi:hypothetical protein